MTVDQIDEAIASLDERGLADLIAELRARALLDRLRAPAKACDPVGVLVSALRRAAARLSDHLPTAAVGAPRGESADTAFVGEWPCVLKN